MDPSSWEAFLQEQGTSAEQRLTMSSSSRDVSTTTGADTMEILAGSTTTPSADDAELDFFDCRLTCSPPSGETKGRRGPVSSESKNTRGLSPDGRKNVGRRPSVFSSSSPIQTRYTAAWTESICQIPGEARPPRVLSLPPTPGQHKPVSSSESGGWLQTEKLSFPPGNYCLSVPPPPPPAAAFGVLYPSPGLSIYSTCPPVDCFGGSNAPCHGNIVLRAALASAGATPQRPAPCTHCGEGGFLSRGQSEGWNLASGRYGPWEPAFCEHLSSVADASLSLPVQGAHPPLYSVPSAVARKVAGLAKAVGLPSRRYAPVGHSSCAQGSVPRSDELCAADFHEHVLPPQSPQAVAATPVERWADEHLQPVENQTDGAAFREMQRKGGPLGNGGEDFAFPKEKAISENIEGQASKCPLSENPLPMMDTSSPLRTVFTPAGMQTADRNVSCHYQSLKHMEKMPLHGGVRRENSTSESVLSTRPDKLRQGVPDSREAVSVAVQATCLDTARLTSLETTSEAWSAWSQQSDRNSRVSSVPQEDDVSLRGIAKGASISYCSSAPSESLPADSGYLSSCSCAPAPGAGVARSCSAPAGLKHAHRPSPEPNSSLYFPPTLRWEGTKVSDILTSPFCSRAVSDTATAVSSIHPSSSAQPEAVAGGALPGTPRRQPALPVASSSLASPSADLSCSSVSASSGYLRRRSVATSPASFCGTSDSPFLSTSQQCPLLSAASSRGSPASSCDGLPLSLTHASLLGKLEASESAAHTATNNNPNRFIAASPPSPLLSAGCLSPPVNSRAIADASRAGDCLSHSRHAEHCPHRQRCSTSDVSATSACPSSACRGPYSDPRVQGRGSSQRSALSVMPLNDGSPSSNVSYSVAVSATEDASFVPGEVDSDVGNVPKQHARPARASSCSSSCLASTASPLFPCCESASSSTEPRHTPNRRRQELDQTVNPLQAEKNRRVGHAPAHCRDRAACCTRPFPGCDCSSRGRSVHPGGDQAHTTVGYFRQRPRSAPLLTICLLRSHVTSPVTTSLRGGERGSRASPVFGLQPKEEPHTRSRAGPREGEAAGHPRVTETSHVSVPLSRSNARDLLNASPHSVGQNTDKEGALESSCRTAAVDSRAGQAVTPAPSPSPPTPMSVPLKEALILTPEGTNVEDQGQQELEIKTAVSKNQNGNGCEGGEFGKDSRTTIREPKGTGGLSGNADTRGAALGNENTFETGIKTFVTPGASGETQKQQTLEENPHEKELSVCCPVTPPREYSLSVDILNSLDDGDDSPSSSHLSVLGQSGDNRKKPMQETLREVRTDSEQPNGGAAPASADKLDTDRKAQGTTAQGNPSFPLPDLSLGNPVESPNCSAGAVPEAKGFRSYRVEQDLQASTRRTPPECRIGGQAVDFSVSRASSGLDRRELTSHSAEQQCSRTHRENPRVASLLAAQKCLLEEQAGNLVGISSQAQATDKADCLTEGRKAETHRMVVTPVAAVVKPTAAHRSPRTQDALEKEDMRGLASEDASAACIGVPIQETWGLLSASESAKGSGTLLAADETEKPTTARPPCSSPAGRDRPLDVSCHELKEEGFSHRRVCCSRGSQVDKQERIPTILKLAGRGQAGQDNVLEQDETDSQSAAANCSESEVRKCAETKEKSDKVFACAHRGLELSGSTSTVDDRERGSNPEDMSSHGRLRSTEISSDSESSCATSDIRKGGERRNESEGFRTVEGRGRTGSSPCVHSSESYGIHKEEAVAPDECSVPSGQGLVKKRSKGEGENVEANLEGARLLGKPLMQSCEQKPLQRQDEANPWLESRTRESPHETLSLTTNTLKTAPETPVSKRVGAKVAMLTEEMHTLRRRNSQLLSLQRRYQEKVFHLHRELEAVTRARRLKRLSGHWKNPEWTTTKIEHACSPAEFCSVDCASDLTSEESVSLSASTTSSTSTPGMLPEPISSQAAASVPLPPEFARFEATPQLITSSLSPRVPGGIPCAPFATASWTAARCDPAAPAPTPVYSSYLSPLDHSSPLSLAALPPSSFLSAYHTRTPFTSCFLSTSQPNSISTPESPSSNQLQRAETALQELQHPERPLILTRSNAEAVVPANFRPRFFYLPPATTVSTECRSSSAAVRLPLAEPYAHLRSRGSPVFKPSEYVTESSCRGRPHSSTNEAVERGFDMRPVSFFRCHSFDSRLALRRTLQVPPPRTDSSGDRTRAELRNTGGHFVQLCHAPSSVAPGQIPEPRTAPAAPRTRGNQEGSQQAIPPTTAGGIQGAPYQQLSQDYVVRECNTGHSFASASVRPACDTQKTALQFCPSLFLFPRVTAAPRVGKYLPSSPSTTISTHPGVTHSIENSSTSFFQAGFPRNWGQQTTSGGVTHADLRYTNSEVCIAQGELPPLAAYEQARGRSDAEAGTQLFGSSDTTQLEGYRPALEGQTQPSAVPATQKPDQSAQLPSSSPRAKQRPCLQGAPPSEGLPGCAAVNPHGTRKQRIHQGKPVVNTPPSCGAKEQQSCKEQCLNDGDGKQLAMFYCPQSTPMNPSSTFLDSLTERVHHFRS